MSGWLIVGVQFYLKNTLNIAVSQPNIGISGIILIKAKILPMYD